MLILYYPFLIMTLIVLAQTLYIRYLKREISRRDKEFSDDKLQYGTKRTGA
ncbi:hypothetical protein FACS1894133_7560 [Clostridia bacterium]|nr:hypothetical protein FACS1894133_7560 [Clostridia bacterium]